MLPWSLKLLRSQTKLMAKDAKNMSRYLSLSTFCLLSPILYFNCFVQYIYLWYYDHMWHEEIIKAKVLGIKL